MRRDVQKSASGAIAIAGAIGRGLARAFAGAISLVGELLFPESEGTVTVNVASAANVLIAESSTINAVIGRSGKVSGTCYSTLSVALARQGRVAANVTRNE